MTLADAFHVLAVSGCRLTTGPDGGIALVVPDGGTVDRQVLDVLRAHRQELAAVAATAPPPPPAPPVADLADYLAGKGITGPTAELVLHAAETFEVRHDRITVEGDAEEGPPVFFEPGVPVLTTIPTEWHEAGRGLVTIPAGTFALTIPQPWAIHDADQRGGIEATLDSIRRHRKPAHVAVWLEGQARTIEAHLVTTDGAVAPVGMNLHPWRPDSRGT